MKYRTVLALSALSAVALIGVSGCVHVSDSSGFSDQDEIQMNMERALDICGEGNVAEVSEGGFTCKA